MSGAGCGSEALSPKHSRGCGLSTQNPKKPPKPCLKALNPKPYTLDPEPSISWGLGVRVNATSHP